MLYVNSQVSRFIEGGLGHGSNICYRCVLILLHAKDVYLPLQSSCMYNVQFRRRPLTAVEFIASLSKIDLIYKEEEEAYKVET